MELKVDGKGTEVETPQVRAQAYLSGLKDGELVSITALGAELGCTRETLLGIRKRACGGEMSTLVSGRICWGNLATIEYINSQKD